MREQIGNAENRVVLVLADIDGDGGAVLANNNTVERQRNGGPLISLDAAVVVGLKERKLLVLVKGVRLQVKAGGVDVRRRNVKSFFERTAADFRKEERLVAVVYVDLVACNIFFARLKGDKALFFEHGNAPVDEFALGFAGADELFVVFAVIIGFGYLLLGKLQSAVFWGTKQLFLKKLTRSFFFFAHGFLFSFYAIYFK